VGSTGIVTCVVVGVIAVAAQEFFNSDFGVPDPPVFALFGVILYGILANVCFTAGWIVELFLRRFSPREADRFAISGFFYGVIFSVLLTLAPAVLVGAVGTFRLLHHLTAR
jgi:Zn-dependent protease with chaperone function